MMKYLSSRYIYEFVFVYFLNMMVVYGSMHKKYTMLRKAKPLTLKVSSLQIQRSNILLEELCDV